MAKAFAEWIAKGWFFYDLAATLKRVAVGFAAAAVAGVGLGVLTGRVTFVRYMLAPLIQALRPIPPIAFVSLAIIWFGIGEKSKYFLVFWGAFFPIWLNTHLGVSQVDFLFIWAAQSLGANGKAMLAEVVLPAALPAIVAGLRTGIGIAFVALIAAELAGSFEGLGFRISLSSAFFRADIMLAAIVTLGVIGALADAAFAWTIKKTFPWLKVQ